MSIFSGKQGKGAMRKHRAKKVEDAFQRQLAIWNDGAGMYLRRPGDAGLTRVSHPINTIPKADRYLYAKQFPDLNLG